jgi:hypothetical protein
MKVFSINPNTGKYFEDNSDYVYMDNNMYQGIYSCTPVYPLYTFSNNGRFNYTNPKPEIEFNTMLPIKRLFGNCFVEIKLRVMINVHEKDFIINAINEFNRFCEMNKKEINVKALPF